MYPSTHTSKRGPHPPHPTPHARAAGPTPPKFQMWVNVFETRRAVPESFPSDFLFPSLPIAFWSFSLRSAQAQVSSVRSPSLTEVRRGSSSPHNVSACGPRPHPEHINASWRASRRGSAGCVCVCGLSREPAIHGLGNPSLSRPSPSAR